MSVRWPRVLTPGNLSKLIRTQKNPVTALEIFNEATIKYPTHRHTTLVYGTMIKVLGSCGRVNEMKPVLQQMKRDSCPCHGSIFADAIRTYANSGSLDEAISLYNSLSEFNCVNFTGPFNALLEIMLKESKFELCHRFLMENFHVSEIKSRHRAFNLLMGSLCGMKRSDLAVQIFHEMGYHCCFPDRESYRILISGLCQDGNFTEAIDLLKGCGGDVSISRIVLEALCDNGDVDEALEVLETTLRNGAKARKRLYFGIRNEGSVEETKALINKALIQGFAPAPSSDGHIAMIVDVYNSGRIHEGDSLIKEMKKKGFKTSSVIYEAKAEVLFKCGEVDAAMDVVEREMIEDGCIPSLKLHNIVIKGLCNAEQVPRALSHFKKMSKQGKRIGFVPDKDTYSYIVDGLCCEGKYMEASQMLEKMTRKSLWPDDENIYTKIIHGLCRIGRLDISAMWLEEMIIRGKVPQADVWSSVVSCVCDESFSRNEILVADLVN